MNKSGTESQREHLRLTYRAWQIVLRVSSHVKSTEKQEKINNKLPISRERDRGKKKPSRKRKIE